MNIGLKNAEYILPKFCFSKNNSNLIYFKKISEYIRERLSIENIIKSIIKNELFRKIIFNDKQLELFNNIPKIKLNVLKSLNPNRENRYNVSELINCEFIQDEKIKKTLEYY